MDIARQSLSFPPAAVRRALPGNTSPLKNPGRRHSHLLFPGPLSPAPGLPAQSLSSCQNLTLRRLPPLFGQQRQRRSPSDCWSPISKRSESGTKVFTGIRTILAIGNQPWPVCRAELGVSVDPSPLYNAGGLPSPLYKAGRLLWPSG